MQRIDRNHAGSAASRAGRGRASLVLIATLWGFPAWPQSAPVAPASTADDTESGELSPAGGPQTVRFRGEALLTVRAQLGSLTPAERARAIEQRIAALASGPREVIDSIRTEQRQRSTELLAGDQFIMSVTDADALPLGRTRQQLAADNAVAVRMALDRAFDGRSVRGLLTGALIALVATLVLAALLIILKRWFPRLRTRIEALEGRAVPAIIFRGVEFLSAGQVTAALVQAARFGQGLAVLIFLILYVEVVLGAFPLTRQFSVGLFDQLRAATGAILGGMFGYLPNILYIGLILGATHYLLRGIRMVFDAVAQGRITLEGFYPEWAVPSFKILRVLIYAFAAVVVFPYLPGSGSPAFQGVSIFLGVLFSLGSTSAIANVIAGLVLTYTRSFKQGDRVKIADTVGDIVSTNLLVVRVRTIKNVDITIPNSMVLSNHIVNFSSCAKDSGVILHSTVTIGYDAPWRKVHQLLIAAAAKTSGIQAEPKPFVLQTSLDDFYVSYELNATTDEPNMMAVIYSELHANIQDAFNEAGVEIMSPHYVAARDGNAVTIPADHLPKSYVAPGFRILPLGPDSVPGSQ